MKNFFRLAAVAVVALSLNSCCGGCDAPKFNAKEYAKNKTERLDKLVELTDAQEKEIYNLYLAQGKEMKKNMAAAKKACDGMKCPDGKKPECGKPCPEDKKLECAAKPCNKPEGCTKKAECEKPCAKKAECKKAECDKPCAKKTECGKKAECNKPCEKKAECGKKAECNKPCAKKAECTKKAECEKPCAKKTECNKKAECEKPCAKKAECNKKAECEKPCAKKAECGKKAECNKPCDKKAECGVAHKPHPKHPARHSFVSPESRKATFEKVRSILTEEQKNKLQAHFAQRNSFAPKAKECMTNAPAANGK